MKVFIWRAIAASAGLALGLGALGAVPATAADVTHTIADVQGPGAATPLNGTVVTVEGVITADYRNATGSGYRGFYLQTADSSGDDFTPGVSDGIFVFSANANPAVALGDLVKVTGTAQEFNGQTQLAATTDAAYELVTAAYGAPAPALLPNSRGRLRAGGVRGHARGAGERVPELDAPELQLRLAVAERRRARGEGDRPGGCRAGCARDRRRQPGEPADPRRRLQHPRRLGRAHLRAAVLHGGCRRAQRRPVQLARRRHGARLGLRRLAARSRRCRCRAGRRPSTRPTSRPGPR